jgi:hypothetical protein
VALLSSIAEVSFFVMFLKEYVRPEQNQLKQVATLATVGASLLTLVQLRGLAPSIQLLLQIDLNSDILRSVFHQPIIPWICSTIFLLFYIVLYSTISHNQLSLKRATRWAILGAFGALLLHSVILFNYLNGNMERLFVEIPMKMTLILMPIGTVVFLITIYFFWIFYKELE